jgi:PAS domain S-box-containing protein
MKQEQVEPALKESLILIEQAKQEWESTVDSLPQFIALLDPQGRIRRANWTAENWGLARVTEVKGQELHELFHPSCYESMCYLKDFWIRAWQELTQGRSAECEAEDKVLQRYFHFQIRPISTQTSRKKAAAGSYGIVVVQDITERKQAEKALQESTKRLRDIVENAQAGYFFIDVDGYYQNVNKAWLSMHGYSSVEEVIGQHFSITQAEADLEQAQLLWQKILGGESIPAGESSRRCKDGTIGFHSLSSTPVIKNGEIVGVEGFITDLTGRMRTEEELTRYRNHLELLVEERTAELRKANKLLQQEITIRKQTEQALRESEQRFRQVIVSVSDHIYLTEITESGRPVNRYLSPHIEVLTGYPLQKFLTDWSFWSSIVIYPEDRVIAADQFARLERGQNSEVEYRLVRADGSVIWVRDSARVERQGTIKIIFGLVSNITERKRAEEEIRQLNEQLEQRVTDRTRGLLALYEVTAVASQALDLHTILEESLSQLLVGMKTKAGAIYLLDENGGGLQVAAYQGLSSEDMVQIDRMMRDNGLTEWVIDYGKPLMIPSLATDSRITWDTYPIEFQTYVGVPIRAGGQVLGILNIFGEMSEQFNLDDVALLASIADQVGVAVENARLHQQAEKMAIMAERERLARDLHDSVTQSLYSLTLFAEGGLELAIAGNLEQVKYNLKRIGETALQALKEMRMLVFELRPLDLEHEGLVGALHRRLSAVEGRSNVNARLVAEELIELPAPVEEGLYRIAQEALNNALKHGSVTTITVYLRVEDEQVELEVVDNGIGFNPSEVSHKGGLGLISMRERAEQLGGSLLIHSIPEKGTRVKVRMRYR